MLQLTSAASERSRALFARYLYHVTEIEKLDPGKSSDPALAKAHSALEAKKALILNKLRERCEIGLAEALDELKLRLSEAHPGCIQHLPNIDSLPSGPSYARLTWLVSVTASGANNSQRALRLCLEAGARWHAESLIMLCSTPQESQRLAVAGRTSHYRSEFGSTKFRWASALIADGVDAWASEVGGRAAVLLGGGRTKDIARMLDGDSPWTNSAALVNSLHPEVREALTAEHHHPRRVEALLESHEPELYPLVPDGESTLIGNLSAFIFNLDLTLFSAIRTLLGPKAQGDALEFVCAFICRRIGPSDVKVHQDSLVVDAPGMKKGDEVDVHIAGKRIDLVLECKSYLPARDAAAAANSFLSDLQGAQKQVDHRVSRLKNGAWIRDRQCTSSGAVAGFVVSLHDYSGEAWNVRALAEDGDTAFTTLPIHSFAMVVGAMKNISELMTFLEMRQALIDIAATGGDELEYLLAWLDGWSREALPDATGRIVQFRPYAMPMSTLLSAEYSSRREWLTLLRTEREPVHP